MSDELGMWGEAEHVILDTWRARGEGNRYFILHRIGNRQLIVLKINRVDSLIVWGFLNN
jgi:hypothetical protein